MELNYLIFLFYLFRFISSEPSGMQINLIRTRSALEILLEQNTHPKHLAKIFSPKYFNKNFNGVDLGTTGKPTPPYNNISIPLFKFLESEFYGELQIGSPAQTFRVIFDPSFSHSWVTSSLCSPFAFPACAFRNKYDSKKSTHYIKDDTPMNIDTDFGLLKGFVSIDKFHVGQVSIENQSFVEIEEMPVLSLFRSGIDGMVGLGINDAAGEMTPVFTNILKQKLIKNPIFAFYLNRDESTKKGGTLLLGGSDPKHRNGSFTYVPVTNKLIWEFKMDKIVLNYTLPYARKIKYLCKDGCSAYPVTGSVTITGPQADVKIINNFISANYVKFLDRYAVSCDGLNKLPKIIFVLGGKKFELHGKDYVQQMSYGSVKLCLSAFKAVKNKNDLDWGLGVSFLGSFYTEFDAANLKIGFAKSTSAT